MLVISKAEQKRAGYALAVRRLLGSVFNLTDGDLAKQDEVWRDWVILQEREPRDLRELVKSDVRDVFKARALAILLAPRLEFSPFAWNDSDSSRNYLSVAEVNGLKEYPLQLRDFVHKLLEINWMLLIPTAEDDLLQSLFYYNRLILEILALATDDDPRAEILFIRYQINDPVPSYSMDDSSGYNPFRDILFHTGVSEKWKRLADRRMRDVIRAELDGRSKPRRDWEKALPCYIGHILAGFYADRFPYSVELFASQLNFILELSSGADKARFYDNQVTKILGMLGGEDYGYLRHRFARHVALEGIGESGAFRVYDEDTMAIARQMLDEFGDADAGLRVRLNRLISEGEAEVLEKKTAARESQARIDAIMARMR